MENEEEVVVPQDEQEVTPEEVTEEVVEEEAPVEEKEVDKDAEARRQLTARAKAAEARAKKAEDALRRSNPATLDVEDYIDISTSLGGLDPVEQAYLAKQHKLTGESMKDLRQGEDFQNWNTGYQAKLEKENALKPSATQSIEDAPRSLAEKLRNATPAEKQVILEEAGLYKESRPRGDRASIGITRTR